MWHFDIIMNNALSCPLYFLKGKSFDLLFYNFFKASGPYLHLGPWGIELTMINNTQLHIICSDLNSIAFAIKLAVSVFGINYLTHYNGKVVSAVILYHYYYFPIIFKLKCKSATVNSELICGNPCDGLSWRRATEWGPDSVGSPLIQTIYNIFDAGHKYK